MFAVIEGRSAAIRRLRNFLQRPASSNAPKRKVPRRRGEYLFGVAPCFAAIQAGRRRIYTLYLKEGTAARRGSDMKKRVVEEVQSYALKQNVDIHYVDKNVLERLSGNRPHQGIVMDVGPLNYRSLEPEDYRIPPVTEETEIARYPIWLALDEVQDPMNFGALLRCAYFLGVQKVLATAKNSCCLSPVVSKASAGAMEMMPVYSVKNMARFLTERAEDGWDILGTQGPDNHSNGQRGPEKRFGAPLFSCHRYRLCRPTVLVLGNEGHGLRVSVEEACTILLTIEPHRLLPLGFDSLNVSVAAGILLHTLKTAPP